MAEKLKTETELYTLELCTDCNDADYGVCAVNTSTENIPLDVTQGILETYNTTSIMNEYTSGSMTQIFGTQKVQRLTTQKSEIFVRYYLVTQKIPGQSTMTDHWTNWMQVVS